MKKDERGDLTQITRKGSHKSQRVTNALIPVCRMKNEDVAAVLSISMRKIDRVKKRFAEEGLKIALDRRKGERVYR